MPEQISELMIPDTQTNIHSKILLATSGMCGGLRNLAFPWKQEAAAHKTSVLA